MVSFPYYSHIFRDSYGVPENPTDLAVPLNLEVDSFGVFVCSKPQLLLQVESGTMGQDRARKPSFFCITK